MNDTEAEVSHPSKINIGCGFDIRPGYLNVDSGDWHKPDLIADVTDLSMLASGSFEEAVAQDVLEHIGRTKQAAALQEWSRLLCDRGVLKVRVPSVVDMVKLLDTPMFRYDVAQQHYWIQMLYGTQAYPGDFHLCGYTCATLADLGLQAGLFLTELSIKDGWLFDAAFRKVSAIEELTHAEFVVHQYATVLQHVPSRDGLEFWTTQLESGSRSREQVATEFVGFRSAP